MANSRPPRLLFGMIPTSKLLSTKDTKETLWFTQSFERLQRKESNARRTFTERLKEARNTEEESITPKSLTDCKALRFAKRNLRTFHI